MGLRLAFEPRRDVDGVADRRVIEAAIRAEVAHGAQSRVDTDAPSRRGNAWSCALIR